MSNTMSGFNDFPFCVCIYPTVLLLLCLSWSSLWVSWPWCWCPLPGLRNWLRWVTQDTKLPCHKITALLNSIDQSTHIQSNTRTYLDPSNIGTLKILHTINTLSSKGIRVLAMYSSILNVKWYNVYEVSVHIVSFPFRVFSSISGEPFRIYSTFCPNVYYVY